MIGWERQRKHLDKHYSLSTQKTCVVCKMILERQHRLHQAAYRAHSYLRKNN